jgi:hypothetical protein
MRKPPYQDYIELTQTSLVFLSLRRHSTVVYVPRSRREPGWKGEYGVYKSPYYHSPLAESLGVFAPPILITLLVLLAYGDGASVHQRDLPVWMWLLFIVGIDVAHVWSTLFRTYLDPVARKTYSVPLYLTPIGCWGCGVALYAVSAALFWSVFAYLAVFHFIRQQYGIYALYVRNVQYSSPWWRTLDVTTVYLGALYPLLYWHANIPRSFYWFIEGDFAFRIPHVCATAVGFILVGGLILQVGREIVLARTEGRSRLPKNFVIWGTVLSWYVGIVHYNADIPFTLTNVVAHGVPYLTLIWVFARKRYYRKIETPTINDGAQVYQGTPPLLHKPTGLHEKIFGTQRKAGILPGLVAFIFAVVLLAFLEEALWDAFIWRDHETLFTWAWDKLPLIEGREPLLLLVPLLAVPQATHYVLDGFIWRFRNRSPNFPNSGETLSTL